MFLKKFLTTKRKFKKILAAILASAIGFSSAFVFGRPVVSARESFGRYFNDSSADNQTRIMMDGNNFLKPGFWMNAVIGDDPTDVTKKSATLKFTIPGYDIRNLKFYVINKNPLNGGLVGEYVAGSVSATDPTQQVYVTNLSQTSYEVHVYNGSLAKENFVCKAEFSCVGSIGGNQRSYMLKNGVGAPIQQTCEVGKPVSGCYQTRVGLSGGLYCLMTLKQLRLCSLQLTEMASQ